MCHGVETFSILAESGEGDSQVLGTVGRMTPDKVVTLEAAGGRRGPSQILAAATAAKHHHRGFKWSQHHQEK